MGYMAHHAIIITTWREGDELTQIDAQLRAAIHVPDVSDNFAPLLVGPVASVINCEASWAFLPDGSKEGWETSEEGDAVRDRLVAVCEAVNLDYVEVRFGGDDPDCARIVRTTAVELDDDE